MLGEIHVALLRSVIKDIEDAAKTPFTGLGANQNCAVNPVGAHPQIVEGVGCCFFFVFFRLPLLFLSFWGRFLIPTHSLFVFSFIV